MRYACAAFVIAASAVLPGGCGGGEEFDLVIMSPHDEKITQEFTQAFSEVFRKAKGRDVRISWRDIGGGTETQLRFVLDQFAKKPDGIDVDIFFGGGIDPFEKMKAKGLLVSYQPPVPDAIPPMLGGVPLYDAEKQWHGTVLTAFGILYNKDVLKRLGVDEPKTWEDMANPKLMGYVGLADPSRSGSAQAIYEMILQAYGWDKGMRVLTVMSGNALDFYQGSSSLSKDVTKGELAMGPAVDYYGWTQVAQGGAGRIGYVVPQDLTVVTPDPIGILKGAPNIETAKMFVDFVMSEEGQRLWFLKAGTPGGPKKYNLMRMPILPGIYGRCDRAAWTVNANPYEFKGSFSFDPGLGGKRRDVVIELMKSTLIKPQGDLRACWKAVRAAGAPDALVAKMVRPPITEAECLALPAGGWDKQDFRARTTTEWVNFAVNKYADVRREAESGK